MKFYKIFNNGGNKMAVKKVYYYKASIKDNNTNELLHNNFKEIFDEIIADNILVEEEDGVTSIILDEGKSINGHRVDRITMDIISNDDNYFFTRIARSKDTKETFIRNIETNELEEVLDPQERAYKTLDICTYCLLDYHNGVVAYMEGQSAANISKFKLFIDNFSHGKYEMIIDNIASTESVRALLSPGSILNKINYEFRVPRVEILNGLGLSPKAIDALSDTDLTEAKLILKNDPRKPLSKVQNVINDIVDIFKSENQCGNHVSLVGKTPNTATQEYTYQYKNYSSSIDIPTTKIINGITVVLSIEEMAREAYQRIMSAYCSSKEHLENLANL